MRFAFVNRYQDVDQADYAVAYFQKYGFIAARSGTEVRCWTA
jgi:hypothetical protein